MMRASFFLFTALFLLLKLQPAQAQEFPFHELTPENGLPHSLVFDLFQDDQRYTWFATTNGLGKYDGHSFENYYDSDGLSASQVMAVTQTGDGITWAATFGGGLHYLENGRFTAFEFPAGLRPKNIFRLEAGAGDRLYLFDNITNQVLVVKGKQVELIYPAQAAGASQAPHVNAACSAADGTLWIGTDDGLFRRELPGTLTRAFGDQLRGVAILDLLADANGTLWLATRGALLQVDPSGSTRTFLPAGKTDYTHVAAGANGAVWTCSSGGELVEVDPRSPGVVLTRIDLSSLNGITDLLVDHEKNLWVSTYGSGARCYYNLRMKNYDVNDGLTSNFVRGVFPASDGTVWLATFNSSGYISYIRNDSAGKLPFDFDPSQPNVLSVAELSPGRIVFAASNRPLQLRENESGVRPYFEYVAFALLPDREGRLWMGAYNTTNEGIPVLENGVLNFAYDPAVAHRRILVLAEDSTGNVWAGSDSGLYCFRDRRLTTSLGEAEGLPSRMVLDLAVDKNNQLWIVTGKGISVVKPGEKKCSTIAVAPRGIRFTAITIAPDGAVWAGSSRGLYSFNPKTGHFFPCQTGLKGNEVLDLAADRQNRLWVGTARGVSLLLPGNQVLPPPPVYITRVTVNGQPYATGIAGDWAYADNTVEISFTGISFAAGRLLTYKYLLKGAGDEWQETTLPHLLFSNLPPGSYTLCVKAVLPDGTESASAAEFSFRIRPPFWMSAWFIAGVVLIFGALLYLFFRLRLAAVKKQAQEKFALHERMVDLEQQASAAMMHPHFIFNALNSIQNYISKNEQQAAHRFLSRFSKLIRLTLENAYKKRVGLDEELERLELYLGLEKNRYQEQFDYEIILEEGLDAHEVSIPSLILQPFVENAIWHGIIPSERQGHISIRVGPHGPDHIRITITDDGVGIDAAAKKEKDKDAHRSLGIDLTRERMELLGEATGKKASITITDRSRMSPPATGTRVEMLIPRF